MIASRTEGFRASGAQTCQRDRSLPARLKTAIKSIPQALQQMTGTNLGHQVHKEPCIIHISMLLGHIHGRHGEQAPFLKLLENSNSVRLACRLGSIVRRDRARIMSPSTSTTTGDDCNTRRLVLLFARPERFAHFRPYIGPPTPMRRDGETEKRSNRVKLRTGWLCNMWFCENKYVLVTPYSRVCSTTQATRALWDQGVAAGVAETDLPAFGRLTCRPAAGTSREVLIIFQRQKAARNFASIVHLLLRVAWLVSLPPLGNITGVLLLINLLHVCGSGSRTFSLRWSWCRQGTVVIRQI